MLHDWGILCREIGERRAGTIGEQRAADFIASRLEAAGCAQARQEKFPCLSLHGARVGIHIREGRRWTRVPGAALVGAPGTRGGRPVEGDLVWLEMPENARRLTPGSLRGRVLALFGPLPTDVATHRRLVAARPAAVIHSDERLPFGWTKNDGVYPHWAERYGMPPTVTIPYTEAWRWRQAGLSRVRLGVQVDLRRGHSQNVVAEHPGSDPRLPAVVICAHHDTQCGNPGADDNGSGVVCVLALARLLAGKKLRRTIRFISFGAEEQLSVGAAAYVTTHLRELPRTTGLVVNFDSVSSPLGHFQMLCAGDAALARQSARALAARGLDVARQREISPFLDNFPFNWAGIPSLCFLRSNSPGGRWQHHSHHDTLENCSVAEVQRLLRALLPFVERLAGARAWTFANGLPAEQQSAAKKFGHELFGLGKAGR